jgi:hypothetical protein
MDQTQLIVELARQIETQQAYHQIWFWLLLAAVSGVAGAIGAFGSSYFGKRGETKARSAHLNQGVAVDRCFFEDRPHDVSDELSSDALRHAGRGA